MKKVKRSILLIMVLTLISGCKNKEENLIIDDNVVSVIESNNCRKSYYTTIDGKDVYLKCIDEVNMKKDGKEISLKEYLEDNDLSKFTNELEKQVNPEVYKDGGTKIYTKNNITIIMCKTMVDEKNYFEDIYIGNNKLTYENTCSI